MLKNISSLGAVLNKKEQLNINGGLRSDCPISKGDCFSGPYYCNRKRLPICPGPLPHTL